MGKKYRLPQFLESLEEDFNLCQHVDIFLKLVEVFLFINFGENLCLTLSLQDYCCSKHGNYYTRVRNNWESKNVF